MKTWERRCKWAQAATPRACAPSDFGRNRPCALTHHEDPPTSLSLSVPERFLQNSSEDASGMTTWDALAGLFGRFFRRRGGSFAFILTTRQIVDREWWVCYPVPPKIMIRLAVAILLLSIPVTDWLTPGLCPEDLQGIPMLAAVKQSCSSWDATSTTLAQQQQQPHQSDPLLGDECFCCCRHVVPQLIFLSPDQTTSLRMALGADAGIVSPTDDPPYHPPRFC